MIERTTSTYQEKSPLTEAKPSSLHANNSSNQNGKPGRSQCPISVPLPTQLNQENKALTMDKEGKGYDRSKSRIQGLKLHAPRLSTLLGRSETAMNTRRSSTQEYAKTSKLHSRIPTPTKPPEGDLYSHLIYRREGRKIVHSSLGRWYTNLKTRKTPEKEQDSSMHNSNSYSVNMRRQSRQPHGQRMRQDSPCSYAGLGTTASANVPPQAHEEAMSNSPVTDHVVQNTTNRSHTMLPVPTTAVSPLRLDTTEVSHRRHPLSLLSHNGRHSAQIKSGTRALSPRLPPEILRPREEESILEGLQDGIEPRASQFDDQIREYEQSPMPRRVRANRAGAGSASNTRRVLSKQPDDSFGSRLEGLDAMKSDPADILSRSRFSLTENLENLKNQARDADPSLTMQATIAQPNRNQSSSLACNRRYNITAGTANVSRVQEISRRKDRAERMAQRSSIATTNIKPYFIPPSLNENEPPQHQTKTQQRQIQSPTRSLHQVSHPQPHQYWLGRFVTLINAFHYEDSFNQPDAATGFGMISSYSRPLGSAEQKNLPDYRTKRAFMVLENACVTDEASRSLRKFQDEYVSIYGDRWME